MKHRLSFGYFNLLANNIVEVIVDEHTEMTLEMIEECHQFIDAHIFDDFGMLINRINNYTYTYEAQLTIASYEGLKAIAFVYYNQESKEISEKLNEKRFADRWNYRCFSGLDIGWQQALTWLQQELLMQDEQVHHSMS
jgi:uncharacterized protein with ParB-like and HNH nuclease domain